MSGKNILWFKDIHKTDVEIVGGKGANLGEICNAGIPVPYGFVITAKAYFEFISENSLDKKFRPILKSMNYKETHSLEYAAAKIQKEILKGKMSSLLAREIMLAYLDLPLKSSKKASLTKKISTVLKNPYVAVRSSATAEDLPGASFAGQQETFLNVSGETTLVKKVQEAWASLFTPRAIFYREEQKFDHLKVGIAVVVQLMVNSDTSGVMFTIDPLNNDKKTIIVEGILGLGELIVQGSVTPDHFALDKKTLEIKEKNISYQNVYLTCKNSKNIEIKLGKNIGSKQKVPDAVVKKVARLGKKLEEHYYFPQDVEWATEKNNIYIVQTRPITTIKSSSKSMKSELSIDTSRQKVILKGDPASPGIKSGMVKIISSPKEIDKIMTGDVLVTYQTNPDFVPAMKKAVAIVTERGGRTSHAAIVSRELGIPAVVGAANATKILKNGAIISVNGSTGEIYEGSFIPVNTSYLKLTSQTRGKIIKTATKIYVNLATPTRVEEVSKMNVDGIGLLRAEFMIADIGTHPKKLIKEHKQKIFIDKLSTELLKFTRAFDPRPVVYRATDFKTNEYRNLIGGKEYEPEEPNPMLGFRGAYRYMSDPKVFELELETIKLIRNKHGYKNLWLMLPFVRTVEELVEVKKIISASGLFRSPSFKLWMMVEIPSNVILLDEFCQAGIDGVSIGSNDLTMLLLGTDRDNTEVAREFNEQNPAVLWAIEKVVKTCHKYKVTSSICGQAPSDYPDLVEKMVKWGITSMSVNADAIDHVRSNVYHIESRLAKK